MSQHAALTARFIGKSQYYTRLQRKLLALGGQEVVLMPAAYADADLHGATLTKRLVQRGRLFVGPRDFVKMEPGACHSNALQLYALSKGRVRFATGYALSRGGLWRQHSWGVWITTERSGCVVETTARRLKYWGVVLSATDVARVVKRAGLKPG